MKLIDALQQLKGKGVEIPDSSRDELPQFFVEMGYKIGAEIGVYKGEFTEKFCRAGLKHYAIDPWKSYDGSGRSQKLQERQDFLYGHTQRILAPYPDCTIIRKTSMDAINDFEDKSLDYVYVDGNHAFRYIAEDIYEWSHKVRNGGVISGHDYFNTIPSASNVLCHVSTIVDAYTKLYDIKDWYVFGRKDKYLSWMWINQ